MGWVSSLPLVIQQPPPRARPFYMRALPWPLHPPPFCDTVVSVMTETTDLTESTLLTKPGAAAPMPAAGALEDLIRYYSEAGPDYAPWMPPFTMHSGFDPR